MTLRFGKYKDRDTSDPEVPTSYLIWLEEQEWVNDALREDLNIEIERREGNRSSIGKDTGRRF
jgi:uncharacterized protein (DUF3820 family)